MTPRLASLLTRVQPAGVILFARNLTRAEQTSRLLRECQKCVALPLFTCVDLEGGTVDRFREVLGPTPAAAEVFATGDSKMFRKHGQLAGECCRALGFNVDFAPVLDLAFEASSAVMGTRAVSADARETVTYAREFLAGLATAKVLGCGKHFPGLGEGRLDSHHDLPVIEKSLRAMWTEDLFPYRVLRRQLPMVMIAHAAYPHITNDKIPASLSKRWIGDILKKRIGFQNLIVSDDLEMGGVLSAATVGEAAAESVRAGSDLCLVCRREERVIEAYESLVKHAERDRKFARRAAEAVRRVVAFKKKWAAEIPTPAAKNAARMGHPIRIPSAAKIENLSRRLWEFGEQVRLEPLGREEDRQSNARRRSRV